VKISLRIFQRWTNFFGSLSKTMYGFIRR